MSADMAFAEFIDNTIRSYLVSGEFRSALHAEAPGAPPSHLGICPPGHPHGATSTCYGHHKCRCKECRSASARRQKQARTRKAVAAWRRAEQNGQAA